VVGTLLLGAGCAEEVVEQPEIARPVKILQVGGSGAALRLEYPGSISTDQKVDMAFEVSGKIIEFPVNEGQTVARGTMLAKLDPRDFQASFNAATAAKNAAKAEFDRRQALFDADVSPKSELDIAQRNYEVTFARVDKSEKALEDSVLKAPFTGVVAKKLVKSFHNVTAKEPVLIFRDTDLEIVVSVPEADYVRMTPGLTLEQRTARGKPEVIVSSIPDRTFPARLKEFTTTADPVTRTFSVTLAFDSPADVVIQPGMTAKVRINVGGSTDGSQGHWVPAHAARTDESGEAFVWVVDPDTMRVRRTPVILGELSGSTVQIRSGLNGGELIAISGVQQLREGMQVRRYET
jgi:RND family efflux transporter MFP subunit